VDAFILEPAQVAHCSEDGQHCNIANESEIDTREEGTDHPVFDSPPLSSASSSSLSSSSPRATCSTSTARNNATGNTQPVYADEGEPVQAHAIDRPKWQNQQKVNASLYAHIYGTCIVASFSSSSSASASASASSSFSKSIPSSLSVNSKTFDRSPSSLSLPSEPDLEMQRSEISAAPNCVEESVPIPMHVEMRHRCDRSLPIEENTLSSSVSSIEVPQVATIHPLEGPELVPKPNFTSLTFWPWPAPHKSLGLSLVPIDALDDTESEDGNGSDVEQGVQLGQMQVPTDDENQERQGEQQQGAAIQNANHRPDSFINRETKGTILDNDGYNVVVDEVFQDDFLYKAPIQPGDYLVSVNHQDCRNWSYKKCWKKIMNPRMAKTPKRRRKDDDGSGNDNGNQYSKLGAGDTMTLVFHNPNGNADMVGSIIRRLYPSRLLRLTLKRHHSPNHRDGNGLLLSEIQKDNLLAHSLLNGGNELLFINQTPVTPELTAAHAGQLIGIDRQTCLLIAKTSPKSGVVVASTSPGALRQCFALCLNWMHPTCYLSMFALFMVTILTFVVRTHGRTVSFQQDEDP